MVLKGAAVGLLSKTHFKAWWRARMYKMTFYQLKDGVAGAGKAAVVTAKKATDVPNETD